MTKKIIQRQDDKHISNQIRMFLISLPIVVGATIFLSFEIAYWASRIRMPRGGFTTIVFSFLFGGFYHIIPFVVIGMIVRGLIRKGKDKSEIIIKLAFMLIPASVVTVYWLFKYSDPFALGFLLYIDVFLLLVGLLVGIVVCKIIRSR
jgi:hypothetical protein